MNKINCIVINNFKILKDVTVNLKNLTVITGVNSSGKSSLIQTLLLLKENQDLLQRLSTNKILLSSIDKTSKDELQEHIKSIVEHNNKTPLNLNGKYISLGEKKDILNQTVYGEDIIIELNIDEIGKYKVVCNSDNLTIGVDSSTKFPAESIINLFANDFQYINTDRIQPNTTYGISEANIRNNLIGLNGEFTAHYLDENRHKLLKIKELRHPDSKTEQFLENVSLWLNEISKGIEVIAKKFPEIQRMGLLYKYTFGENTTNEYTPMNVGFGITYVLPIIVTILKSKPNDLLIIENPESHLHPAGQVNIAKLCAIAASKGVQIIIETHSDHFLNGIRVATKKKLLSTNDSIIYYFEKDSETISTNYYELNIDENGNINEEWPEGFFDEYGKQLDELIW